MSWVRYPKHSLCSRGKLYPKHSLCSRGKPSQQGFTLVEIVVVLIILGMVAGMAVLGLEGRAARVQEKEAQRLQAVLNYARDDVLQQGYELGLILTSDQYRMVVYNHDNKHWEDPDDKHYRQHALPDDLYLEAEIEGQSLDQSASNRHQIATDDKPDILLLSSGENTLFTISLRGRKRGVQPIVLSSDGYGRVLIQQPPG